MGEKQLIPGLQATREAIKSGAIKISEIWIKEDRKDRRIEEIQQLAKDGSIPVLFKKSLQLDHILPDVAHQGIIAFAQSFNYVELNQMIRTSLNASNQALIVVADHITDEGNLGALIRVAAFFKAHGLVLPKNRSARVTDRVLKRSAGSSVYLPVTRVVNLGRALDVLSKQGFWIIGAAGESPESIYRFDWKRDLVLVLGSEDKGLSRAVKDRCHQLVGIPAIGYVDSLNVSIASGVILSEITRQRAYGTCGAA
jgi:23S rRNA (guanosine2251-2'-O)-methyltransferase